MLIDLDWLKTVAARHSSVDTFAKKLFIKGETEELTKLKVILSVFFILEQLRNKVDQRYDSFFAALLQNDRSLPNHLRILSWNYDLQFELAFSGYSDVFDIKQPGLYVSHKFFPRYEKINKDTFGLYKLNGTTSLADRNGFDFYHYISSWEQGLTSNNFSDILKNFGTSKYQPEKVNSNLSFAWEQEKHEVNNITKAAEMAIIGTTVLVIIGYSYPFFNRETDRILVNAIAQTSLKIYIQDLYPESVKESFLSAWPAHLPPPEFVYKKSVKQFFLPP